MTPCDYDITVHHASDSVEALVRAWFAGEVSEATRDGARSVRIPHPEKPGHVLKIKGAGFMGGPVDFGNLWKSGPSAPIFDFDGRMMEDIASGHDNAYRGGTSFQQAVVEYRISQIFHHLDYNVVSCLGYGRLGMGKHTSWFSLFELDQNWKDVLVPDFSIEEFGNAYIRMGHFLMDVATSHHLVGHCWYVGTRGGDYFLKDLHPFRSANAIDMSQVSWVMQVFFSLHIVSLMAIHFPRKFNIENVPEDFQTYPFRGVLPDAKKAEHEELRKTLVSPYMLRPPESFDQTALLRTLYGNRITRALMEICPEEYARP